MKIKYQLKKPNPNLLVKNLGQFNNWLIKKIGLEKRKRKEIRLKQKQKKKLHGVGVEPTPSWLFTASLATKPDARWYLRIGDA